MNSDDHLHRLVKESLDSTDNIKRAVAPPFLLTRIQAKLNSYKQSRWERTAIYIGRPAVYIPLFCLILLINGILVFYHSINSAKTSVDQVQNITTDDFSNTTATIYDSENQ